MTGTPRPQRTQGQVTVACDRVVTARGGVVVVIGRNSVNQTPGLPPRRYLVDRVALWFYPRTERGKLSAPAVAFVRLEITAGSVVGAGDEADLEQLLRMTQQGGVQRAAALGYEQIDRVIARGCWTA